MPFYLGPPGNLQTLPYMGKGIQAALDLASAEHRALAGPRTVDYIGPPKRTYTLSRAFLTADELGLLEALALGMFGAGPYALVDPWRRNLLDENQSSGGDYSHDTTGFTVLAGSNTATGPVATANQGSYHQQYLSPASGAAGTAGLLAGDRSSAAQVLVPGNATVVRLSQPYTFQAMLKTVAGTAAAWRASLLWYDVAGALISTSNGTGATVTGSFVQYSVTATAPATAAYAVPGVTNNATLAATNTIAVDSLMLSQASAVAAWVPGTGVPRVAFTALGNTYPLIDAHDSEITLLEVA